MRIFAHIRCGYEPSGGRGENEIDSTISALCCLLLCHANPVITKLQRWYKDILKCYMEIYGYVYGRVVVLSLWLCRT